MLHPFHSVVPDEATHGGLRGRKSESVAQEGYQGSVRQGNPFFTQVPGQGLGKQLACMSGSRR